MLGTNPAIPDVLQIEEISKQDLQPWMMTAYEDDKIARVNRNPEVEAKGKVGEAGREWAEMLLPLKGIEAHSIPNSLNGSALREMRSAVYSSSTDQHSIYQVWSTKCPAPIELLKMVSGHWHTLDDGKKTLVLSALCGWLSTKIKRSSTDPLMTDADFVANLCLGIHASQLFPRLVTEHLILGSASDFDIKSAKRLAAAADIFFRRPHHKFATEQERRSAEKAALLFTRGAEEGCKTAAQYFLAQAKRRFLLQTVEWLHHESIYTLAATHAAFFSG